MSEDIPCLNCQKLQDQLDESERTNFELIEAVDKAARALKILSRRVEQLESANFKLLDGLRMGAAIDRKAVGIVRQ